VFLAAPQIFFLTVYGIKCLTKPCKTSLNQVPKFWLQIFFPTVYDIKYLMKFCDNLHGGLNKLAETLDVARIGPQHQARCARAGPACLPARAWAGWLYLPACLRVCRPGAGALVAQAGESWWDAPRRPMAGVGLSTADPENAGGAGEGRLCVLAGWQPSLRACLQSTPPALVCGVLDL
jgi:hypothetical protein